MALKFARTIKSSQRHSLPDLPSPHVPRQTLRRWLVARKWDVEAAKRALVVHAEWRAHNLPHGRITEDEVRGAPGCCRAAWLSQQKHT